MAATTAGRAAARVTAPSQRATRAKPGRRKTKRRLVLVAGGAGCAAAVAAAVVVLTGSGTPHVITAPHRLMGYTQQPSLAAGMGATALRQEIISKGSGEASHVVDAVYEETAKTGPQIVLFVGGNISGSGGSFIAGLTQALPGSFTVSPGSLAGQAVCAPPTAGRHLAECAWADNDTFGVIASPTLSAQSLGNVLREVRPLVELTAR